MKEPNALDIKMTKITFDQLKKDSATLSKEKEFNKTLFVPKKNSSYIIELDCNNIEQITKLSKKDNREFTAYRFNNIKVDNQSKNWDVFSNTYDLFLMFINEVKPTAAVFKVVVETNDKGYISKFSLFEEQSHSDNLEIESIDVGDEEI